MIIAAILFGLFGGAMTIEQIHYSECKKINFQDIECSLEKKLESVK